MVAQMHTVRVRQAALRAIVNLAKGGTVDQIAAAVDKGAIPAVADMLTVADTEHIVVALEGLASILASERERAEGAGGNARPWRDQLVACGGVAHVEALQSHASEAVRRLAVRGSLSPARLW